MDVEPRRLAYETARLRLSRYQLEGSQARARAVDHAVRVSAEALDVERVGVWLLKDRGQRLVCAGQYVRSTRERVSGQVLQAQLYPTYFRALAEHRVIAASHASSSPHTVELDVSYLKPNGITSLLDAPLIREGRVFGVVRHEHVGHPREWSQTDLEFATAVADSLALMFEQADRLELEAALQQQAEQRQESQKMEALGRMACSVAHDFNNLLSTIALTVATIGTGVDSDELPSLVAEVEDAVQRGEVLVKRLLTFGDAVPHSDFSKVELGALIDRTLPMLRTAIGHQLNLKLVSTARGACFVQADASQLEQVLLNLCLNARDALDGPGEVSLLLREATVSDEVPPDSIVLEVHDAGKGMDQATLARVFEPFFTTKRSASGLGLATVYGIVTRCGGVVRALSEPGAGTTMLVALPLAVGG